MIRITSDTQLEALAQSTRNNPNDLASVVFLLCDVFNFIESVRIEFGTHRTTDTDHKRTRRGERAISGRYDPPQHRTDHSRARLDHSRAPPFITKSNTQPRQLYGATSRSHNRKRC